MLLHSTVYYTIILETCEGKTPRWRKIVRSLPDDRQDDYNGAMNLDPSWSLNRVRIVDLPGLHLPDDVKGKVAYELVSAERFTQLIRERSDILELDPTGSDHSLHLGIESCFRSRKSAVRTAAFDIVHLLGRSLGYILLTLKRGDPVNRAARPEWDEYHWQHWSGIQHVWLGGGLTSGQLGTELARHANHTLRAAGMYDLVLRVSPYGVALPLVGAARHTPPGFDAAVVLDFGSSMIKSAIVAFARDRLARVRRLPSRPSGWAPVSELDQPNPEAVQDLISSMVSIIANTWVQGRAEGQTLAGTIPVCIAAYVADGNPMRAQAGVYMQTRVVADNLEDALGKMVSSQLGKAVRVKLLHDGTAAAAVYSGVPRCAVVTLGTALGIGFPDAETGLRPLASGFELF
jgi:hypothetical protein